MFLVTLISLGCPLHGSYSKSTEFKSQFGQDAYAASIVGGDGKAYLDIGCNDGIDGSNTYYFYQRGWYGKCFEADRRSFRKITKNSGRVDGVNAAISSVKGYLPFMRVFDPNNGLSGLQASMSTHASALHRRFNSRVMKVRAITPLQALERYYGERSTIDFVSLDVEGGELDVIRAWPFDRWCVRVLSIEDNNWCNENATLRALNQTLESNGYLLSKSIGMDYVFTKTC